ncbi:acetokinase family protein [Bordetella holmesii 70147]|nr:acetokinase family protein [Bordetella holmesii 70147]
MNSQNTILVINAGSSSIKFYLYGISEARELSPILGGQLEGIGTQHSRLVVRDAHGQTMTDRQIAPRHAADVRDAQEVVGTWLSGHLSGSPLAVGHRVVHGGPDLHTPVLVDDAIIDKLKSYTSLAPLHQPNNLAPIQVIRERLPALPQVACFDTAFHRTHSAVADRYAVPETMYQEGVHRYGFHGLSYEYVAQRLQRALPDLKGARSLRLISGRASRPAPCSTARAWTAPWALPHLKACPWAPARPSGPRHRALAHGTWHEPRRDPAFSLPRVRAQGPVRHRQ